MLITPFPTQNRGKQSNEKFHEKQKENSNNSSALLSLAWPTRVLAEW